jgi:uncharacterized protein (TIGR00252 family)
MDTTNVGRYAEQLAAEHLISKGYEVIIKNWRNRWCEVDIIAKKDNVINFVEVKYRQRTDWGDGLDVITNKKLKQIQFAAQMWVNENNWMGDYRLLAISLAGNPPRVTDEVEI